MVLRQLKALPDRWRWLGVAIAVQKRFGEVNGGQVAGALTLAMFLSLFPLLLVGLAVIGFFAESRETFTADVIENLGITSDTARETIEEAIRNAQSNRRTSSIIGVAGLLWAGLGVVGALQYAINAVWQVQGRGLRDRLYALLWLAGAAILLTASFTLAGLLNVLPGPAAPVAIVAGAITHTVLFWWTFHVLSARDVGWRPLLPGAVAGGIGLQALTAIGAVYVPRAVADSSAVYGSIGVIFALLAWLFIIGRLIVYASVLNVVLFERTRGTVSAEIRVPHLPGMVPLGTTRAGAIAEAAETPVP